MTALTLQECTTMTRREEIARIITDDEFWIEAARREGDTDAILSLPAVADEKDAEIARLREEVRALSDALSEAGDRNDIARRRATTAEQERDESFKERDKLAQAALSERIRAEEALKALADLTDAFLTRHRCFPLDRVTEVQRQWNEAMVKAYAIVGQPGTGARTRLVKGS
jgi:hypothetical protein